MTFENANVMKQDQCFACGIWNHFEDVLDLGEQPLANSFKSNPGAPEAKYPLAIHRCRNCTHIQLKHVINPDLLFKDYIYRSGTAKTQLEYFEWFTDFVTERYKNNQSTLNPPATVLDIGCNDGSQLKFFKKSGYTTYGVDPAENLFDLSSRHHKVHCGYFNGGEFPGVQFDVIICQNAFAHNNNPEQFLQNVNKILKTNGLVYITTSQVDMIPNGEFDTIYHEHLSFYTIKSMRMLARRSGLFLTDVLKHSIHGTSYIFVLGKQPNERYIAQREWEEEHAGLYSEEIIEAFRDRANHAVEGYRKHIEHYRKLKIPIIGYGAPAKGNTFMNYAGVGPDFVVDDSPSKQGMFTPGLGVPVVDWTRIRDLDSAEQIVFVPYAWNFFSEIVTKIFSIRGNRKEDRYMQLMPDFVVYKNFNLEWGTGEVVS